MYLILLNLKGMLNVDIFYGENDINLEDLKYEILEISLYIL